MIHLDAAGNFTETGYLPVAQFQLNNARITAPGLNHTAGATPYGLYVSFTATGTLNGFNPAATTGVTYTGTFSAINYTLNGDVGGNAVMNIAGITPTLTTNGDTQVTLASGALSPGTNLAVLNFDASGNPLPSAFSTETFDPLASESGFFVGPTGFSLFLTDAFTNNTGVASIQSDGAGGVFVIINGGGGNATLLGTPIPTPEPATLTLLGTGLFAAGVLRRKRKA